MTIAVVIVLAAIYGKAIFILDKQLGKCDKSALPRSTKPVAEMTTDKHVSKKKKKNSDQIMFVP